MKTKQTGFEDHKQQRLSVGIPWLLSLLLIATLAGCTQHKPVANASNPAGTYMLVSVDGNKTPCNVQHEGHTLAIKSGTFTINADGTCSSRMLFTPPSGVDAATDVKATYTQDGAKLTMLWQGAGTTTGTVAGDEFTMNNEGMVLRYRK